MARRLSIILVATLALCACVGDSTQPIDAGNDASINDAVAPPDGAVEAAPGACIFGTSHFGDGCKFQP